MRFRLRFDDPGYFVNNPHLEVTLDGRTLYTGTFKGGFDVSIDIEPGRLEYSRLKGNFEKRLSLTVQT